MSEEQGQSGLPAAVVVAALNTGGAERHAVGLANDLSHSFRLCLLAIARAKTQSLAASVRGPELVELDRPKLLASPGAWWGTWRALRRRRPRVIFTVNAACAFMVLALRRAGLLGGKVVCVFHTTELQPHERPIFALFRRLSAGLDAMVYVSERQKAHWQARGVKARESVVITNGVDSGRFDPAPYDRAQLRTELGYAADDYVVGVVAALRPEKRHLDIVAAFARLGEAGVGARLLIVGDGGERAAIEGAVQELGLDDHVRLAGDQADVRPFIAACDVCVLASAIETFSLASLEILAMGVPLISSDVGGQGEIVSAGDNGLLYPAGDTQALAAALARLADPTLRNRMAGAARPSAARHDIALMRERYLALARRLAT